MNIEDKRDVISYFTPDQLRVFLADEHPDDYHLIDIRPKSQYDKQHLPGALSIPVETLFEKSRALEPSKKTILYCNEGVVSLSASRSLRHLGFSDIYILQGGFKLWQFGHSTGCPEFAYIDFFEGQNAADQSLIAWSMEEMSRQFYSKMSKRFEHTYFAAFFDELASDENRHKETLKAIWEALTGRPAGEAFPPEGYPKMTLPENGESLDCLLKTSENLSAEQVIDYAMAMELTALDHHLYLKRHCQDPNSQRLFEIMADEEKRHLGELGHFIDKIKTLSKSDARQECIN